MLVGVACGRKNWRTPQNPRIVAPAVNSPAPSPSLGLPAAAAWPGSPVPRARRAQVNRHRAQRGAVNRADTPPCGWTSRASRYQLLGRRAMRT